MTSEAESEIAKILLQHQTDERLAGLQRLLDHYSMNEQLAEFVVDCGLPLDLNHPFVEGRAWSLVGPKIAEKHSVFSGRKKGAPKKGLRTLDVRRAAVIQQLRRTIGDASELLSDAKLITFLRRMPPAQELFGTMYTESALRNSVSRGHRGLAEIDAELMKIFGDHNTEI